MRAAVHRRTASGAVLGEAETVSAPEALAMFLGDSGRPATPRLVQAGAQGDLCVLSTPPAETVGELDSGTVAATVIAGEVVFERS
jgi:predicted amidohydrolase YtcJ